MEAVKQELVAILLSLVKGLRVLVTYIVPSVLIAIVLYPNIIQTLQENPDVISIFIINAFIKAIADYAGPKVEQLQAQG